MKGRNTQTIGFRVSDEVYRALALLASQEGLTVGGLAKARLEALVLDTTPGIKPISRHCSKEGCVICQIQSKCEPWLFTS